MKALTVLLCVAGMSLGASAQELYEEDAGMEIPGSKHSVSTRSFWSNWFVSAGVTNNAFYSSQEESGIPGNPFRKERNAFGFELTLGKWFTPGIGLRTQFDGLWGKAPTWRGITGKYRYMSIHEDVLFNLSNLLYGYKERRVWNFVPHVGIGLARNFSADNNNVTYSLGVQNTWRINRSLSAFVDVSALFVPGDFDGYRQADPAAFRMRHWDKTLSLSVGVTYALGKKKGWDKSPNLEALLAMDREQINALEMSLEEQQQENMRLAALLENSGDGIPESGEANPPLQPHGGEDAAADSARTTPAQTRADLSVFFDLGSAEFASGKEMVNLKALAEFAKANGLRIVVTGYADTRSGSPEANHDISLRRAQAVADALVKMGVDAAAIRTVAGGAVDQLAPYSYNRRAVISLEQ